MVRMQIQLTREQYRQLKLQARRCRRSLASLVREGVEKVLEEASEPDLEEARRHALLIAKKYWSGKKDTSVQHDRGLAEIYKS